MPQSPGYHRLDQVTSLSLVERLRRRDQDGWQQFLSLYAPLVARWCLRQGLKEHDAADIAQEVFRKVAEHIETFHKEADQGSFRGWICRVTHNAIADSRRRGHELVAATGGTEAMMRLHQTADRPVEEPDGAEQNAETGYLYQEAMKVAQTEFTERMWQIFWRVTVDGNSATAVAEEFGATPAAVRQIKSRILRRLKQIVGDVAE